jgi:nucleoside 2-deoxyribosyltransferase
MKIQICGSMTFAKEMKATQQKLQALGHSVTIPVETEKNIQEPSYHDNLSVNLENGRKENIIKANFDLIANADAIVVLNYSKNGTNGYLGTSTLMEIGLAYYLGKKIFLLNPVPSYNEVRWAHEIELIQPVILRGELEKIQ